MEKRDNLGRWLKERCEREHLSLRQAAVRTGLSHSTIADVIRGNHPSPETMRKLAQGFGGDGKPQKASLSKDDLFDLLTPLTKKR